MLTEGGVLARPGVAEVAVRPGTVSAPTGISRAGYDSDVPMGGANKRNPGGDYPDGRAAFMQSLYNGYVGCPWLSAPIDAIARTVTAGGLQIVPGPLADESVTPDKPPPAVQELQALLNFCNPYQDIIQLIRGTVTDLGIYGDAFIECVWLLGRIVALYALDPATMTVDADEHGDVLGYDQVVDTRERHFEPHEVIHISMDSPKGSLYGMGIGQKALLPVTTWLFAAAVVKETMKKGDPPKIHLDFPLEVQPSDVRDFRSQYQVRNLGSANIGNPITTRGLNSLTELQVGKLIEYAEVKREARDEILSVAGVPPSKVGIIESGNLGGGTGTDQDKTFRVNTCGPIASIVLEKLNFHITQESYGITDWVLEFVAVDWRDDKIVEDIRDERIRNGSWTLNNYLTDIGEPTIGPEGDVHVLVTSKEIITWDDLQSYSTAAVDAIKAKGVDAQAELATKRAAAAPVIHMPGAPGQEPPAGPPQGAPPSPAAGTPDTDKEPPTEAVAWRARVAEHYQRLLATAS